MLSPQRVRRPYRRVRTIGASLLACAALLASLPGAAAAIDGKSGINLTLATGLTVSGIITGPGSTPIEGAQVTVMCVVDDCGGFATSTSTGAYTAVGLPADSYTVYVQPPDGVNVLAAAWAGTGTTVPDEEDAVPIVVSTSTTGIDLALSAGHRITGRITAGGTGVAGLTVDDEGGSVGAEDVTDASGNYELVGIDDGTYQIDVTAPDGSPYRSGQIASGYVVQSPTGDSIVVAGGDVNNVNASVAEGVSISGTISGLGGHAATINVNSDFGDQRSATVTGDGPFSIPGLWRASYDLQVLEVPASHDDQQFPVGTWNGSALSLDSAASVPIDLSAGRRIGLALVAPAGGGVSGVIRDRAGAAVAAADVSLCSTSSCDAETTTSSSGAYAFRHVPAGWYQLRISSLDHPDGWNAGGVTTPDQSKATPIGVRAGARTVDVLMPVGAYIAGRITMTVGTGVAGVSGASISAWPVSGGMGPYESVATTASDGTYRIKGLPAGKFMLEVNAPEGANLVDAWWSAGGPVDSSLAGKITITLTRPTITSRSPAPRATGVPRTASVKLVFSEPVSGMSATTLRLVDTVTGLTVPARSSYAARTRTATIVPGATLATRLLPLRTYKVVVSAGILDWDALSVAAQSYTFKTAR